MKRINLKDVYSNYLSDYFIEVEDEIAELLKQSKRKEHADFERRRVYKAYYSLDAGYGLEKDIVLFVLSPEEIFERKQNNQILYSAINSLPDKQAKRICAHYFLDMSRAEIARIEGVSKSAVTNSIKHGLKCLRRILKNFF